MTIFVTIQPSFGAEQILCYNNEAETFVPYCELKYWIAQKLGLYNQTYDIQLFFGDIHCGEDDSFKVSGCNLNAVIESVYYLVEVHDHLNHSSVRWTERFVSEQAAAQHLFVWLIQKGWLDIQAVIDSIDNNEEDQDDTKDARISRQLREILEDSDAEKADIYTGNDLWDWCQVIRPGFERFWSFDIVRKRVSI